MPPDRFRTAYVAREKLRLLSIGFYSAPYSRETLLDVAAFLALNLKGIGQILSFQVLVFEFSCFPLNCPAP